MDHIPKHLSSLQLLLLIPAIQFQHLLVQLQFIPTQPNLLLLVQRTVIQLGRQLLHTQLLLILLFLLTLLTNLLLLLELQLLPLHPLL